MPEKNEKEEKPGTGKKKGSLMKELLSGSLISDKKVLKNFW